MYNPRAYRKDDAAWAHSRIEADAFGILFTADVGGPVATHLPFLLDRKRGALGTLIGHVARANAHWKLFDGRASLAVFAGPHAYVSPRWYQTNDVPTWNYVAVHATGAPRVLDEASRVRDAVERLVARYETGPEAWALSTLGEAEVERNLKQIVAFEMPIDHLEGKAKLSQNRSVADQRGAQAALATSDGWLDREVGALMLESQRRGPRPPGSA